MRSHHQPEDIIADQYQIVGILGEGNSGITYQAKDLRNQQQIALKAMSLQNINDWKLVELFDREAKILGKLNHPNIPTYLDYFQVDTTNNRAFYIAQELAQGKSLVNLVENGWHKSEAEIKEIAIALLKVLVYLHLQKPAVIHRDIKPQNIIYRDDGKIFLVDFGAVGNTYHNTITRGSTVVGTYGYMAPEQFRGLAFPATDLYGLGATLLYLLTHRSPAELPTDRLRIDFRSHIKVSEEFGDWLEKILEPDMSERFSSAASALEALQPKKISITKYVSWKAIVLTMGISMGTFFATKSLSHQKYAVFNKLGLTPHVHAAIYQDLIDVPDYLAKGGDINGKDKQGKTLLHYAVEKNKLDLIKLLIYRGADINQVDINGNTALYKAIDARHTELISLLEDRSAKLNNKDLKQLKHSNIPKYINSFQIDTDDNRAFYLVQQLAPGKPLSELIESGWKPQEAEVKNIARKILEILTYLQQLNPAIVHRDIKPQNIIRQSDGKIFLVDFGAVQDTYHHTVTGGSTVVGTFGYMAPEQFRGKANITSDLYGLGTTLLYLLTRKDPSQLPQKNLKIQFRQQVYTAQDFTDWLDKMLAPASEDRFKSAQEALAVLQG